MIDSFKIEALDIKIRENVAKENYFEAFKYCRAQITQYMIYVKSHTEPFMYSRNPVIEKLIEIDIKALSEILNRMIGIIFKGSLKINFENILKKSKNLFFNAKWHKKVDYHYIAWRYIVLGSRESAKEYLKENVVIKDIQELDFLEMAYDLYSSELTFTERYNILYKLIAMNDLTGKVHYQSILGLNFFIIGDKNKAIELHNSALELYVKNKEKFKSTYDLYIIANAYAYSGKISLNRQHSKKAVELFLESIKLAKLSSEGQSEIFWLIGLVYIDIEDYENAQTYMDLSINSFNNSIAKIFKSLVYIYQKDYENAFNIIDSIEYKSLSKANKIDYLMTYSQLLIYKKDKEKMQFILSELQLQNIETGYFSITIKDAMIKLLEEYQNMEVEEQSDSKVIKALKMINQYMVLRPSLMGIGIDINKLIDKALDKRK